MSNVEVGAYFYPLTRTCPERQNRAEEIGRQLGIDELEVPNELQLARDAQPLFEGHEQPVTYCIERKRSDNLTDWDDAQNMAFTSQAALAAMHGLSYFVIDTYRGFKQGRPIEELRAASKTASQAMRTLGKFGFKYARMEVLEGPRAALPVPNLPDLKRGFGGGFAEPDRGYDVTTDAARFIVDKSIEDWQDPAYLRVEDWRPCLWVMMPNFPAETRAEERFAQLDNFIQEIKQYALVKYGLLPYITGVLRQSSDAELWDGTVVDAITQYCALHEHGTDVPPIQRYDELIEAREYEWYALSDAVAQANIPFLPSVAVGWDASPRGEPGYALSEVVGLHPYTPIVTGNTPDRIANTLDKAVDFAMKKVPKGERRITIFAWNEVGEGGTLLPRLQTDGTVDISRLEAVSEVIHRYDSCNFCRVWPQHRQAVSVKQIE